MNYKIIPLEERIVLDAAAAVIYVDGSHVTNGNGDTWMSAYNNIQDALAEAATSNGADQIWIAKGTYVPGTAATDSYNVPDQVSLYGGFNGTEKFLWQRNPDKHVTTLSGEIGTASQLDNIHTIVRVFNATALLDGLTVTAGYNPGVIPSAQVDTLGGNGAGVVAYQSNLTINDSIFTNHLTGVDPNFVSIGGAVNSTKSTLTVLDSTFLNNSARNAAAIGSNVDIKDTIIGCTFMNNTALVNGGSIFFIDRVNNANATNGIAPTIAIVKHSLFQNNVDQGSGGGGAGGITAQNITSLTVDHCQFIGNSQTAPGGQAGAVNVRTLFELNITHSLFKDNTSVGNGGAISVLRDVQTQNISYNLFLDNHSNRTGGAIFIQHFNTIPLKFPQTVMIDHNIFRGNTTSDTLLPYSGGGAIAVSGGNTFVTIQANLFADNSSATRGGAIGLNLRAGPAGNLMLSSAVIENNVFVHNSALLGGAIYDGVAANVPASPPVGTTNLEIRHNAFGGHNAGSQDGSVIWLSGLETTINGLNVATSSDAAIIDQIDDDNFGLLNDDNIIIA